MWVVSQKRNQHAWLGDAVDLVEHENRVLLADAKFFDRLTYLEALSMRVGVLDGTAITLCMEHDLPIFVVNLSMPDSLTKVVQGEKVGTLIYH